MRVCFAVAGGWAASSTRRSGVPINVTISRPDTAGVVPGGNSRGTQRPDLVPGVDPYLKDGVRWLNPAAFTTPANGVFGNLPRNFVRGPSFSQVDLMFSKDLLFSNTQNLQVRVELFNIANRLNYENPVSRAAERHGGRALHRRAGGDVRLHARTAQPHGRPGHRATDADFASLFVLKSRGWRLEVRGWGSNGLTNPSP